MNNKGTDRIILIDKPSGVSSFGVVARVRHALTVQVGHKVKVGHCGTLDPFATGLLILVSGKFTKRAQEFSKLDKVYEATVKLGYVSSTADPEGEIELVNNQLRPSEAEIKNALAKLTGKIEQRPPVYSAIKINGQRAYKLARAGKANIDMPVREVEVYSLTLTEYSYPYLRVSTHVSSGTYIRSLAVDLGNLLNTGAYVTELRRLKIAHYDVSNAEKLTDYVISDKLPASANQ